MATVQVRHIVRDVDAATGFYTSQLGFNLAIRPALMFAMLSRGGLRVCTRRQEGSRRLQPGGTQASTLGPDLPYAENLHSVISWRR